MNPYNPRSAGQRTFARTVGMLSLLLAGSTRFACSQSAAENAAAVLLKGNAATVQMELAGGSISAFRLTGVPTNPLSWDSGDANSGPRPMGHFLCLDRWGPPSAAEQLNGMPFHGEASRVLWRVVSPPRVHDNTIQTEVVAALPLAGLEIHRHVRLSQTSALLAVTERIRNTNRIGRIYNVVQHPTVAPPFLDENTLIDSNATRGFMQSSPLPNPEQPEVRWPHALNKGAQVDLRRLSTESSPNVVSYIVEDEYGWTTAASPSHGLLIGYMWRSAEYGWFNAWRHAENERPAARGLEFGTTGLHQPFPVVVRKGPILGRPTYEYIDANETQTRSYVAFLLTIPPDYRGVARITYTSGRLSVYEQSGRADRTLTIDAPNLFPR